MIRRLILATIASFGLLATCGAPATAHTYEGTYTELYNSANSNRNLSYDTTYPAASPLGSTAPGAGHVHSKSIYASCSGTTKYQVVGIGGWATIADCTWKATPVGKTVIVITTTY